MRANDTLDDPMDLLRAFRRTAGQVPDRTAVSAPDGVLTFAELDARASALAGGLVARGVRRGSSVGVCLPRGTDLPATLLAVWRAGAAYLPIDPGHPPDRRAYMLADAGASLMVTAAPEAGSTAGVASLPLDELAGAGRAPQRYPSRRDPAYVIYTSGSTGRPKGVRVSHGNVANLMRALERGGFYAGDHRRVAWNASISFDASVQQWIRLCRGDTLVLLDDESRAEPDRLAAYLSESGVTDLDVTPSHWQVLRDHVRERLDSHISRHPPPPNDGGPAAQAPLRLFVGGEAIPPQMWSDLAADRLIEAVNLYGPTECTVDATAGWVTGDHPHIGTPVAGVRAYVLDGSLGPVATGELYIAGAGVSDGYVNRPGLTAQAFVADPYAADGSRMYRTGDRARQRDDGTLECLGRLDRQIKLNGYRIELGEIESVLAEHAAVARALVTVRTRPDPSSGQSLVAYYLPAGPADPSVRSLREHLSARLPDFMMPTAFVALDAVPLSISGKVAWAELPDPDHTAAAPIDPDAEPAGQVEQLIASTWAEVLGRDRVLATDDFFDLGGHSLVALRVVSRVKAELGLVLPTRMVYRHPRLRDLAARIEQLRHSRPMP